MHKIMGAEDFELEWCYEQYADGKIMHLDFQCLLE